MRYIMIQIDDCGRSPLEQPCHVTGRYGEKLRPGVTYHLWHQAEEGRAPQLIAVRLSELFTHIQTKRAGQSPYVWAEMEVID